MGPVRHVVALAGDRTVQLDDTRRVVSRLVHVDAIVVVPETQSDEAPLCQPAVVGRKVNAIEKVCAVARVREDRIRPTSRGERKPDRTRTLMCRLMLSVRG